MSTINNCVLPRTGRFIFLQKFISFLTSFNIYIFYHQIVVYIHIHELAFYLLWSFQVYYCHLLFYFAIKLLNYIVVIYYFILLLNLKTDLLRGCYNYSSIYPWCRQILGDRQMLITSTLNRNYNNNTYS